MISSIRAVLDSYGLDQAETIVQDFGTGLINHTWKIESDQGDFILQRINTAVFPKPEDIAFNIHYIGKYLQKHHPEYFIVLPVPNRKGEELVSREGQYFRLFPFVKGSHTLDTVQTVDQAFKAARQFGRFTHFLSGIDMAPLRITIPGFHDLSMRFRQFQAALETANYNRVQAAKVWIEASFHHRHLAGQYEYLRSSPAFRLRVMHHDTKISNVLLDEEDRGLGVIDLDTVMPGYYISDVGDMMRTYLSPVSEEEGDFDRIEARPEFYQAIVEGYLEEMRGELNDTEKEAIHYAGEFMIYMQGLRFLADYLNGDPYYGSKYPGHNLVRAGNQLTLLSRLMSLR